MPWITGGAILGGALLGSNAANKAASGQAAAANAATAEERRQFDQSRTDLAPWRDTGSRAIQSLNMRLGLGGTVDETDQRYKSIYDPLVQGFDAAHQQRYGMSIWDPRADASSRDAQLEQFKKQATGQFISQYGDPSASDPMSGDLMRKFRLEDFQNDPVNQIQGTFALDEGRKAIERRAAASGGWDSGAALKALTRYGSDYGNQRAGESYNRFVGDQTNQFNRLASVSGIGQTAANTTATLGANMANNVGANTMQAANARGAAGVAGANAITGGIGTGLNFMQNQQFLNRLTPQSPQVPNWNPMMTGDFPNSQTLVS